ncbi:enoyl-CoA hydratase/isomerase family protein [Roseomonas chloroacetimidivorans]|uniref:enoyl-CoA hydratase/isomerase family protein n=1 Tax=Roseomonas chloroacetimidivorans TaxID=1766656 RepID=UPI003C746189
MMMPHGAQDGPRRWPEALPGLSLSRQDAVVLLRINAPPLNLLTQVIRRSLGDAFLAAAADDSVRCVVFLPGPAHLCAGADLSEFPARRDPAVAAAHADNAQRMILALVRCPKPVLVAAEGACLGGGYELALGCDLIIAARNARVGLPEVHRGVWPGTGGLPLLARRVGPARAKGLAWAGEVLEAEPAYRQGLVDQLVEAGQAETAAVEQAARLAHAPAGSVRDIKSMIDHAFIAAFRAHLAVEHAAYVEVFGRADATEGFTAFREKRPPRWLHR